MKTLGLSKPFCSSARGSAAADLRSPVIPIADIANEMTAPSSSCGFFVMMGMELPVADDISIDTDGVLDIRDPAILISLVSHFLLAGTENERRDIAVCGFQNARVGKVRCSTQLGRSRLARKAVTGDRLAARIGRLGFLARELLPELPAILTELEA